MTADTEARMLRLHILGAPRAFDGHEPLPPAGRRDTMRLFWFLLLRRAEPVLREQAAFVLWSDTDEVQARANFRRGLSRLQHYLPATDDATPWILRQRGSVQWNPGADWWLDAHEFETLCGLHLSRSSGAGVFDSLHGLRQAAGLYDRPLLEGITDDWVLGERDRLATLHLQVLDRLCILEEASGHAERAVQTAERLLAADRAREATYRLLMRLTYAMGDQAAALRWLDACRDMLSTEFGAQPMDDTLRLGEAIRDEMPAAELNQLWLPRELVAGTVRATSETWPANLPSPPTRFIGRSKEISALRGIVADRRIVTLVGPGGCGKTRLGIQLAADLAEDYPGGVWWVDLAGVSDPRLVAPTLATELNVAATGPQDLMTVVAERMKGQTALLVLDNCEHVLEAAATLVEPLAAACPDLTIVATSREKLAVPGELVWTVPRLSVPPPADVGTPDEPVTYEAVELFVDRARSSRPGVVISSRELTDIAAVSRRLEGMPLAIELAAGHASTMELSEIATELADNIHSITRGSRSAVVRHRALSAAIDWSVQLLAPAEQALLGRLSVFPGGFTEESAVQVCAGDLPDGIDIDAGAVPDLIRRLESVSLLSRTDTGSGARYRMLETIRQHTDQHVLSKDAANLLIERRGLYFAAFAAAAQTRFDGSAAADWLMRTDDEIDNLRSVVGRAISEQDVALALGVVVDLQRCWLWRGRLLEAMGWLDEILAMPDGMLAPDAAAKAMVTRGLLALENSDLGTAKRDLDAALDGFEAIEDQQGVASTLHWLGGLAQAQGDTRTAREHLGRSLQTMRSLDDARGTARVLSDLGQVECDAGDPEGAKARLLESLAIARSIGSVDVERRAHVGLSSAALVGGSLDEAREHRTDALRISRAMHDRPMIVMDLNYLGVVAIRGSDFDEAQSHFLETLDINRAVGDRHGVAAAYNSLGIGAAAARNYEAARDWYEQSLAIVRELGLPHAHHVLLRNIGSVSLEMGDVDHARQSFQECLTLRHQLGHKGNVAAVLEQLAETAHADSDNEAAVVLLGGAEAVRIAGEAPVHGPEAEERDKLLAALRSELGDKRFEALWTEGLALSQDEAVARALR